MLGVAALALVFLLRGQEAPTAALAAAAPKGCIEGELDAVGGPISLVGPDGQTVTEANFKGAPAVLYFGFTRCPDICPMTMYGLGAAVADLGEDAQNLKVALISLDPGHDTPQTMAAYATTEGFPPGLIGLSGSAEQIAAAARAFRVNHSQIPQPDGDYLINHTSFAYVMDTDWRTKAMINTLEATPEELSACIRHGLGL